MNRSILLSGLRWFIGIAGPCTLGSCMTEGSSSRDEAGGLPHGFIRRGDTILYHTVVLDSVDTASFQVLDGSFCKDKQRVFYFDSYRESRDYFLTKKHLVQELVGADASTFEVLGYEYAKDSAQAWYQTVPFRVADLRSLQALDVHFVKDDVQAYLDRKPIRGSHGRSFALIDHSYARDSTHYYYIQGSGDDRAITPIPCDVSSVQIIDLTYAKDKDQVYYRGGKLSGAVPSSFVVLGSSYAKDAQSVYFREQRIAGADPASFVLFSENDHSGGETYYARDKERIYVNAEPCVGVDKGTFRILDEKYTADRNGVYYRMKRMPEADLSTFKVYPHYLGDADAEDKAHKYGDGKVVE